MSCIMELECNNKAYWYGIPVIVAWSEPRISMETDLPIDGVGEAIDGVGDALDGVSKRMGGLNLILRFGGHPASYAGLIT